MTTTTTAVPVFRGLPVYPNGGAPDGLMTRAQLRAAGLRLRPGQRNRPRAWLYCMPRHHHAPLYEAGQATPRPALSERQLAALEAGRAKWWARHGCPDCGTVHTGWCQPAVEAMALRDRREAAQWAAEVLADPATVALDTETTGLEDGARVVEIAVLKPDGTAVLDTLVNPGIPVPAEAAAVHGITTEAVAGAPTFSAILPALTEAVHGKRVVIYNAAFDRRRIALELDRYYRTRLVRLDKDRGRIHPAARAWLAAAQSWECAMEEYAAWCMDVRWDDYRNCPDGYYWQPLNGGHRALDDCRAVLSRLRDMARDHIRTAPEDASGPGVQPM